jgi:HEAT repeat protein
VPLFARGRPNVKRLKRRGRLEGLRAALRYHEPYADAEEGIELDLGVPIRAEAAEALSDFPATDVAADLAEALGDPEPVVRLAAVEAIARLGTPTAIDPLVDCAVGLPTGPDDGSARALDLLVEWHVEGAPELYAERLIALAIPPVEDRHREDLEAMLAVDPRGAAARGAVAEVALAVLRGSDERSEDCAETVLSWLGPSVADRVLGPLADGQATPALVRAAGNLGDARIVEPIIGRLASDDAAMRSSAALAAGALNHTLAVPALLNATRDDEQSVRDAASDALNRMGMAAVIAGLAEIVGSELGQRAFAVASGPETLPEDDTPASILTRTQEVLASAQPPTAPPEEPAPKPPSQPCAPRAPAPPRRRGGLLARLLGTDR